MSDVRSTFVSGFGAFERRAPAPPWLTSLRKDALGKFEAKGFPSTRHEDWRYTNLNPVTQPAYEVAPGEAPRIDAARLGSWAAAADAVQLVFINGRYSAELSRTVPLPAGVTVTSLRTALSRRPDLAQQLGQGVSLDAQPVAALNSAFIDDGALIEIPARTTVHPVLELLFIGSAGPHPVASFPRILILVGAGSEATVVETYLGFGGEKYFTNAVTEISLAENAHLQHYKFQHEADAAFHVALTQARQASGSRFESHAFALGGALARNEVRTLLDGEGGECVLNGLYLGHGSQHLDQHTLIDHAKPRCKSRELYKGVLDGKSHGVFSGRVVVRLDAQKTDSSQTNKTLLLSDDAMVDAKPQLEILADDVKCAHGAAVGQLDESAMFYLRSRGIDREAARNLLTLAFVSEVVELITVPSLRERVGRAVGARLGRTPAEVRG